MIVKELLIKILNENHIGLYLKSRPLEELPANNGVLYKVNEIDADNLINEYNSHFESPPEE